jgi:Mrp family chromosome partitioning ATPase
MSVIDPATTPSEPEPNNLTRTVAFGGLLGLLVGISLAVGRELMDSRPRLLDILENELGVTILAVVPWQRHFGRRFYPALDKLGRLRREAFQRLRTSVLVRRRARAMLAASVASNGRRHTEPMALLVVSDRSGSGCSSVVSNLGASLANGGQRVVLVDTNFAHPSLHLFADGYAEPGVSQWLSDSTINVSEMIQPTHVRGLFLLASGGSDPSASDRLVQPGIDELVLELRSAYDFILLDSPSLARSSDAELLRSAIDAIVLVARPHGQLHERDIREAVQFAGDKLLGIVLNGLTIPRNLIALNSPPRPLSAAETIFDEQATGAAKRLLRERG